MADAVAVCLLAGVWAAVQTNRYRFRFRDLFFDISVLFPRQDTIKNNKCCIT